MPTPRHISTATSQGFNPFQMTEMMTRELEERISPAPSASENTPPAADALRAIEDRVRQIERAMPMTFPKIEQALADALRSDRVRSTISSAASAAALSGLNLSEVEQRAVESVTSHVTDTIRRMVIDTLGGIGEMATARSVAELRRVMDNFSIRISAANDVASVARVEANETVAQFRAQQRLLERANASLASLSTTVSNLEAKLAAIEATIGRAAAT